MNTPTVPKIPSLRLTHLIAITAIVAMAGAYFLFLYGTWHQFQDDRVQRDKRLDQLLDKLGPKEETVVKVPDDDCEEC